MDPKIIPAIVERTTMIVQRQKFFLPPMIPHENQSYWKGKKQGGEKQWIGAGPCPIPIQ